MGKGGIEEPTVMKALMRKAERKVLWWNSVRRGVGRIRSSSGRSLLVSSMFLFLLEGLACLPL